MTPEDSPDEAALRHGEALRRGGFGLANAFDRFVTQIESETPIPDAVAVACAEATMWACALDEQWRAAEGQSYWVRRDATTASLSVRLR